MTRVDLKPEIQKDDSESTISDSITDITNAQEKAEETIKHLQRLNQMIDKTTDFYDAELLMKTFIQDAASLPKPHVNRLTSKELNRYWNILNATQRAMLIFCDDSALHPSSIKLILTAPLYSLNAHPLRQATNSLKDCFTAEAKLWLRDASKTIIEPSRTFSEDDLPKISELNVTVKTNED
jgi:hypothetical protein